MTRDLRIDRIPHIADTEISGANHLRVAAGTNGFQGGDTGHGGQTYFAISDAGGTDMTAVVEDDGKSVRIAFGGDEELRTFIEALRFALSTLETQSAQQAAETR
jgi:hypothetical protein